MYNLGDHIIDPSKVSVISPLMKIEEKDQWNNKTISWHLLVVVDGMKIALSDQDEYKMRSYREGLKDVVFNSLNGKHGGYR